jgi:hypothetical protein
MASRLEKIKRLGAMALILLSGALESLAQSPDDDIGVNDLEHALPPRCYAAARQYELSIPIEEDFLGKEGVTVIGANEENRFDVEAAYKNLNDTYQELIKLGIFTEDQLPDELIINAQTGAVGNYSFDTRGEKIRKLEYNLGTLESLKSNDPIERIKAIDSVVQELFHADQYIAHPELWPELEQRSDGANFDNTTREILAQMFVYNVRQQLYSEESDLYQPILDSNVSSIYPDLLLGAYLRSLLRPSKNSYFINSEGRFQAIFETGINEYVIGHMLGRKAFTSGIATTPQDIFGLQAEIEQRVFEGGEFLNDPVSLVLESLEAVEGGNILSYRELMASGISSTLKNYRLIDEPIRVFTRPNSEHSTVDLAFNNDHSSPITAHHLPSNIFEAEGSLRIPEGSGWVYLIEEERMLDTSEIGEISPDSLFLVFPGDSTSEVRLTHEGAPTFPDTTVISEEVFKEFEGLYDIYLAALSSGNSLELTGSFLLSETDLESANLPDSIIENEFMNLGEVTDSDGEVYLVLNPAAILNYDIELPDSVITLAANKSEERLVTRVPQEVREYEEEGFTPDETETETTETRFIDNIYLAPDTEINQQLLLGIQEKIINDSDYIGAQITYTDISSNRHVITIEAETSLDALIEELPREYTIVEAAKIRNVDRDYLAELIQVSDDKITNIFSIHRIGIVNTRLSNSTINIALGSRYLTHYSYTHNDILRASVFDIKSSKRITTCTFSQNSINYEEFVNFLRSN